MMIVHRDYTPTVQKTHAGTLYLREPGVAVLSVPHVDINRICGFLDGFAPELQFNKYSLELPTRILIPESTILCKVAGQTCYLSFGPGSTPHSESEKYIRNILEAQHDSVLEHANFTLLLWGTSRSMTHEIVRHRAGFSYSQVSQRYVDGSKLRFVERPEYVSDVELHALFEQRIDRAAAEYNALAECLLLRQQAGIELFTGEKKSDLRKKVNQAARSILPNETEAPIVITANARAWRHFIEMRASAFAEVEIRRLAFRVYTILFGVDPYLFMGYTPIKLDDGTDALESKYRKV